MLSSDPGASNDCRCNRRSRTAFHVGGGACDGSRGRNAAKERADNIGDPERNEFLVGVVPVFDHAIRDHCAKQRFDCGQQGDGHGGPE